jgi:hypothetical protein
MLYQRINFCMPVSKKSAACELSHVLSYETLKTAKGHSEQKEWNADCVVLLHDNALPHTAASTRALLENFNWEFDYSPYSSDFTPSDYHMFTYLKNWLRSQLFNDNDELTEGVKMWLSSQVAEFFDTGIQNLHRYDKCLNSGGDYVEK